MADPIGRGTVDQGRLEDVRRVFDDQLKRGLHPGAALAVYMGEDLVLDLWGGFADLPREQPVEVDTLFVLFSSTKPLASMSVWRCVERGLLDIEAPVADVWPAFARHRKGGITVRQVLDHTAGIPMTPPDLRWEELHDWDRIAAAMEDLQPVHDPGSTLAYSAFNHGWLCGEIVRRVDGRPIEQFFRKEIAEPLGMLDTWIGAPASELDRVSRVHAYPDVLAEHLFVPTEWNRPEVITAPIPAASGVSTARDMARFYAAIALGGSIDGRRVWSAETVRAALAVSAEGFDTIHGRRSRRSAGFFLGGTPDDALRMGSETTVETFGHGGAGTSICWGDIRLGLAIASIPNGFHGDRIKVERNREVSDAVRRLAVRRATPFADGAASATHAPIGRADS